MKVRFLPVLIIFLLCGTLYSQNTVSGNIVDTNDDPVAFANVILLDATDSTSVYKGVVSDEKGEFTLNNIADSSYLLKISFVGYQEFLKRIKVKGKLELKTIVLEESSNDLDEVTVNARRPKIRKEVDRLVFDVENSSLSTTNTFEILKRTPGVIVSQGQLLVRNQPATVYINDRRVYLTSRELQQLLEGFSGENVKSVEVITNPPAKYDAEGGVLLNITTSKNLSVGYKGSLTASNTIAVLPKYSVGTSQYYKNDWVNFFGSYNLNIQNNFKRDESFIQFYEPGGAEGAYWEDEFERDSKVYSHNINTIVDFTLSEKSDLSISSTFQFTPKSESDIDGRTRMMDSNGNLDSLYTTDNFLDSETNNILLNAVYNTRLSENATLTAKANYINYKNDQDQDLFTQYVDPNDVLLNQNSIFTLAQQRSDIYTGSLDYAGLLGSLDLETGLKYSGINSTSGIDFYNTLGTLDYINDLSDELDYDENIYAGYISMEKAWEKWSVKAGLRGEYTDALGVSTSNGVVNKQDYFQLFPTFYLNYNATESSSFGVDYSRRINRARFSSLNPYRYFINENYFNQGNPYLQPSITNKIKFNWAFKNKLFVEAYWERIEDAMAILPFQDNEQKTLRYLNANTDFDQQYSLDITYYDYLKDWWVISVLGSFFYMQTDFYALENQGQVVTNDMFTTYMQAYNLCTLDKNGTFTAEWIGTFLPNFVAGSYEYEEPQYGIDIGLRKTFFNGKLIATVNADDILNSRNIPLVSRYLDQNNGFFAMPESRRIRFGVTYKFGNFRLSDNSRSTSPEESGRLKEAEILD